MAQDNTVPSLFFWRRAQAISDVSTTQ